MSLRKLTIAIDDDVYQGLYEFVGRGNISRFINDLARPIVVRSLDSGYAAMAEDEEREAEARQWSDNLISDVGTDE